MLSRRKGILLATILGLPWSPSAYAATASANLDPAMSTDVAAMMVMAGRFPQRVRVGDLAGRYLLQPTEAQTVLGRIGTPSVFQAADGSRWLTVRRRDWLGLRSVTVAVAVPQVALLGEHVVLIGLMPDAFARLPPLDAAKFTPVEPNTSIQVGIVGPFH